MAGVSRSSTIAIAYLMKEYDLPLTEALEIVKTARPIINPNKGFMELLQEYDENLAHWRF